MTPIRCPECGHTLGVWNADGEPEMRHRGRRVVGFRLVECECCGAEWRPDTNTAMDTGVRVLLAR